jgi:predicted RNase H-like nuclease (RuvC/YqgF family)
MVEKYLNRKGDEDDDESTSIADLGLKLDDSTGSIDPMEVKARTITFGKEVSNAPKDVVVKEKSEKFKDQMSNTNQYLKFINAHLAAKKSKIEKLKESERRFKEEIESLQSDQLKPRAELDKVNYKYITENDTKSLLSHLETERHILQEKLSHQEQQVKNTVQQIQQKDEHILQIKNELNSLVKKNSQPSEDPIAVIKDELAKLGIKDDSAKILDAVNSLSSLLNSKK